MYVTCFIYVITVTSLVAVSAMDQAMKDYILKKHNEYRRGEGASNMAKLEWDAKMESEAASWAANCEFKHKGMGENLAWNSMVDTPEQEMIDKAMKNFFDEKLKYSYGQQNCGSPQQACHYTQLVWAKTTKVGCATKICEPLRGAYNKAWYLVCRYDPNGNWQGEKPYEKGAACSACNGATCDQGLCVGGAKGGAAGGGGGAACTDSNGRCADWAKRGECDTNASYMKTNCKKSCKEC